MARLRLLPNSLAARIVLLMSLAMLPLGLISIYQTHVVVKEARALSRAALMAETVAAAAEERTLIQRALGAARGLAGAIAATGGAECPAIMSRFIEEQDIFIHAAFVDNQGMMNCSSSGAVMDLSHRPTWVEYKDSREPRVTMTLAGAVTRQSVILATQPVLRDGQLLGSVTISIPHWIANALLSDPDAQAEEERTFRLASINLDGQTIAASGGLETAAEFLPRDIAPETLAQRAGQSFRARAGNGEERFFAVAPMIDNTLVLLGSWPTAEAGIGPTSVRAQMAVAFPALMWVAGIGVAFFGLQRLVVRNVRQLSSAMRRFALGERDREGLELDNPPEELEGAQRAFNRMALLLSEAEARQEDDLRDKEVLLREVHHRVKNNLQLIASIMNMQARNARSNEARQMLAGLQRRVRGLATLHRTLYTTPDMTTVDAAALIRTVISDVSNLSPDIRMQVISDLEPFDLYPDQAVPLSMLVAEALTNAFKYSNAPEGQGGEISVRLQKLDGQDVELCISNTVAETAPDEGVSEGDGLGNRLMTAFVRQLDGTETRGIAENRYVMTVVFPRRDFDPDLAVPDA